MDDDQRKTWLEVSGENMYETAQAYYWNNLGQPWRTLPEISSERQSQLLHHLQIQSDTLHSVFPFKEITPNLTRADIEWMISYIEHTADNQTSYVKSKPLDLCGANLRELDLSCLPLFHMRFGAHIYEWEQLTIEQQQNVGAHLENCNLSKASLQKAYLCGAHLESACLQYANLQGAHLQGAMLSYATVSHAHLERANLLHACLQKTDIRNSFLQETLLNNTILEQADGSEARFYGAEMKNIKAAGANFRFAHFEHVDLSGSILTNTYLHDAHFEGANLRRAHLEDANLTLTRLRDADITQAHLERANMSGAQCEKSIFAKAHFDDTDCHRVNFAGANLSEAFFNRGTQLNHVILTSKEGGTVCVADTDWNNVNLAVVEHASLHMLGDEETIDTTITSKTTKEDRHTYQENLKRALRAYRQFAHALQSQGLNEEANRFYYRSYFVQCKILRSQQPRKLLPYILSLFLALVIGYGYRPVRTLGFYCAIIVLWAILYHINSPYPSWETAFLTSFLSFHGQASLTFYTLNQRLLSLVLVEMIIGLLLEATFIVMVIKRIRN
jgi:uncharacterized protein YjbI with pentapeptide repeats